MIAIRAAAAQDARAIAEVHVASWRWAYRDTLSAATLDALDIDERERGWSGRLAEENTASETLVAVDQAGVVGFCGYGPSRDADAAPGTGEVYTIYLLEETVGHGVGRELFARAAERLRALGYRTAMLWVLEANERTRRFYEAAGWTADGSTDRLDIGGETHTAVRYRIVLPSGGI